MKPKKYSLLYFHHLCDKYSKWIFPLHEGENIIGSDKNVDIFLYLNEIKDKIESIHCKIILDESQNNISIISLTDNGIVKLCNDDKIEILSPGKEYILKNKSVFYLGENLKFTLVYDTMDEIYKYFLGQRLENEYQKWENEYNEACSSLEQRKEKIANVISKLENNMDFLCVTGVEDLLQDDVMGTIDVLRYAGMKVWMLTGDKVETATCISISAGIKSQKQKIFTIKLSEFLLIGILTSFII